MTVAPKLLLLLRSLNCAFVTDCWSLAYMAGIYELLILSADVGTRSLPEVPRAAITISFCIYCCRPFKFILFAYDGRISFCAYGIAGYTMTSLRSYSLHMYLGVGIKALDLRILSRGGRPAVPISFHCVVLRDHLKAELCETCKLGNYFSCFARLIGCLLACYSLWYRLLAWLLLTNGPFYIISWLCNLSWFSLPLLFKSYIWNNIL